MKNIFPYALAYIVFFCTSTPVFSQTEAEMKAWQAYMTPGDMHKLLASTEGEWTAEMKGWMDPNSQPIANTGTCTYRMIMGGRYQEMEFKGEFMGQPFEGKGVMAYDNQKKKFEGTWVDNMGTGIMRTEGTYNPSAKTFTMTGKVFDPATNQDCNIRETLKIVDDNTHVMTMYNKRGDKPEFKSMEITFKRKM